MRIQEIFLGDNLRGHHMDLIPLCLKFGTTLFSGGIDTEDNILSLICIVERVELLFHTVDITLVSKPVNLRGLVEEESRTQSLTKVLKSKRFKEIGLNTLTRELHRSRFSMEIMEGIFPCLSRVSINLPSVLFLRSGPLRDFEALENTSFASVERHISYTSG